MIAGLVLLESLFNLNFNIDLPDLHRRLQLENTTPGRMALNTILALMMFATGLLVNSFNATNSICGNKIVRLFAFAVIIIGCLGVIGYGLKLENLYNWGGILRMSLPTAVCVTLLGLALFDLPSSADEASAKADDVDIRKIYFNSALVISLISITAAAAAFSILQHRTEALIADQLLRVTKDRMFFFNSILGARSERVLVAAKDTGIAPLLTVLNKHPDNLSAQFGLRNLSQDLSQHGFLAIVYEDLNGRRWPGLAELSQKKYFSVPFKGNYAGVLLWEQGYGLLSRVPVFDKASAVVGYMIVQQELSVFNRFNQPTLDNNSTSDMLICSAAGEKVHCFPSILEKKSFLLSKFYNKQRLPISYAVDLHQSGVKTSLDYRGKPVLAAYGPIGDTGIGMMIKIDIAEIYAPIREQFQKVALLVLGLLICGLWLIHRHLLPLVQKINRAKELAQQDNAKFVAAAEGGMDSFYIFDAVRDAQNELIDFRCSFINQKGSELISRKPNEFLGKLLCQELPLTRGPMYFDRFKHVIETGHSVYDELELIDPNIQANWLARQVVKLGDGVAITARDITAQKLAQDNMQHLAMHDALTNLPNRTLFEDRLRTALKHAERDKQQIAIALIDLDYFKHINDTYGHPVGDVFLQQFTQRLTENIRPSDTLARLGGDEFALILPNIAHPDGSIILLTKLFAALQAPLLVSGHALPANMSIGICTYPDNGRDFSTLVRHADEAMYSVKAAGRNNFKIYRNA